MDSQVAIVTGSGRRLGRKIAIALAENGFDMVINYNHSKAGAFETERAIKKLGRRCIVIKADVTKSLQVQRMVKQVVKTFGKVDVLVNNAAVFIPEADLLDITEMMWDGVINTNLKSVFICAQTTAAVMMKQKSGKIINIASLGAFQAWPKHIPYCVSKAGVVMLTKVMAKSLAPFVTVNAIAPGTIILPGEESGEVHHPPIDKIPLRKYGKPSDITDAVIFLVKSSDYITGQIISVDGGVTTQ